MKTSDIKLLGADDALIAQTAAEALADGTASTPKLSVKDISGNSGAKTYLCLDGELPRCIVKVQSGGGIMDSHPNTAARVDAAATVMRAEGIAPPVIMKGADFHVEASAGTSVMKDFFHFDEDLAPPAALAGLLAKLHALPVDWYAALKDTFLQRDPAIAAMLKDAPDYAPCWCLPWTGLDTGMPVLGVGNPNAETAKKILSLELETGVFEKIMLHPAFQPTSDAARRQVVVHNDFKPDNVLRDPETGALTAIDYDLVQVGPAVMDFGLPYMMWLGARFTTFEFRQTFIRDYLDAAGLGSVDADVRAMMLDCEVNTIVAFPGLLSNIYDAEVPLLRGVKHPTAKAGVEAGSPDDSPTGLELVDLLAEAIQKVRADEALIDRALRDGLVVTLFNTEGLGSAPLYSWLKEIQRHRMLRLFGIAETDGGEIFVSDHAKK